jgi:hypothetical protein
MEQSIHNAALIENGDKDLFYKAIFFKLERLVLFWAVTF